mgnify:FL=1
MAKKISVKTRNKIQQKKSVWYYINPFSISICRRQRRITAEGIFSSSQSPRNFNLNNLLTAQKNNEFNFSMAKNFSPAVANMQAERSKGNDQARQF